MLQKIKSSYALVAILTCFAVSTGCDSTRTADSTPKNNDSPELTVVEPADSAAATPIGVNPQATSDSPHPNPAVDENQQNAFATNPSSHADGMTLRILSWNVESEGADSAVIAKQLGEMGGYDIYGLTEVLPEDLSRFREALGKKYKYAYSKTGFNDRLQLLYNEDRFELVRKLELNDINFEGRYRSPLVIHLRDRANKAEFMVMVNHLARGKADIRTRQAEQLVEWARGQTIPIFGIGDYNFDFVFETETGNDGFRAMLRDNIWQWVRPDPLVDTNWYDPEKTGNDVFPGSILDFAFVAGQAMQWNNVCNVIVRDGDFPDDETTSDHRPFELIATR